MPRRTGVVRRTQPQPELFERSEWEWRRLGAPKDLWNVELAAAAELAERGAILEFGEVGYPGPSWWYARRHWRRCRPPFLAAHDAFTPAEVAFLTRARPTRERRTDVRPDRL